MFKPLQLLPLFPVYTDMKRFLFFISLIVFFTADRSDAAIGDTLSLAKPFTKAQLMADVHYLTSTIADVHPNMYHNISRQRYKKLTDSIVNQLHDGMTGLQAWPLIARLIGALNEGHSVFSYPDDIGAALKNGDILFPVTLREFDGKYLVVRADGSSEDQLQAGDKIVSINGIGASRLVDDLTTYTGGIRLWRANDFCRNLVVYMYLYNIRAPYHITYIRNDKTDSVILKPVSLTDYITRLKAKAAKLPAAPKPKDYSFNYLDNGKALLTINSLTAAPAVFKPFLDSVFTTLKQKPSNTLIIDLRKNGGGNSALGYTLLGYITDKPFRMAGGVKWKISQEYKDQIKKNADSSTIKNMSYYLDGKNGSLLESGGNVPEKPEVNELRYKGRVLVLIGSATFSSANMLANAIQDYKLATLIGEPSGEPANDYGELIQITLPNTRFIFTTSTKQFVRANGNAKDQNPVLPDHVIKDNPLTAVDEVLEYAEKQ